MSVTFRYLVVVVAGFGLDFAVALAAHGWLSVPLPAAAAIGFICGFLFNYALHEFWTFHRHDSGLSPKRMSQALLAALAALAVRVGFLAIATYYMALGQTPYALLLVASGLSLIVNFVLLRVAVFR